tara:strand:- start:1004 stop:1501 length:498 start_codon:yes stop_codon:yes gene_type:complete
MNIRQINLFREMVRYFELAQNNNLNDVSLSKVRYAKETLDDLEDKVPTERQLELENKILNFEHLIKQKQLVLRNLNFYQTDGCSESNSICDLEHEIKTAEDELKQIHFDKIEGREQCEEQIANEKEEARLMVAEAEKMKEVSEIREKLDNLEDEQEAKKKEEKNE